MCGEPGELQASRVALRHGFADARDATLGVFQHRLASGVPQAPKCRTLAAGPAEGIDLSPQLLQRCQVGSPLSLVNENRNRGGRRIQPEGLDDMG